MGARTRAFTLVELLVAVAIVAVMAAILLPVFSASRAKGRQVRCAANMRQVGQALLLYTGDHGGLLPPASTKVPGGRYSTPWQGQLDVVWWDAVLSYLRDDRLLYCPSAPPFLPTYRINAFITGLTPGRLDLCSSTSETLMLTEGFVPIRENEAVLIPWASEVTQLDTKLLYHLGRMNACFADGHVRTLGLSDLGRDSPLWKVRK